MTHLFLVQVELPDGCTVEDMRRYIWDAVGTWKGQLHPDEPLFDLDDESVLVQSIPRPTPRKKRKKA
jgi:hypothetical protein